MKCVWDIVSVHVSIHGISDYQCYYKASANEFCQRQLWTWWNGQSKHEKLALCGLGILHRDPCFFLYPVFDPHCLCLKESGPPFHHWCSARGGIICSSTFALFISVPNWILACQAQAWPKVIFMLLSPRVLFRRHFSIGQYTSLKFVFIAFHRNKECVYYSSFIYSYWRGLEGDKANFMEHTGINVPKCLIQMIRA